MASNQENEPFKCTLLSFLQLTEFTNNFASVLHNRYTVDCFYLNFHKAFDLVSYSLLIQKLAWYNINSFVIEWSKAYLNFRRQVLNEMQSDQMECSTESFRQAFLCLYILHLSWCNSRRIKNLNLNLNQVDVT